MGLFLCRLGPPAVVKSAMSNVPADRDGTQAFQLLGCAHQIRAHGTQAGKPFCTTDPLDRFDDGGVANVMQLAPNEADAVPGDEAQAAAEEPATQIRCEP
jgi:hypothetical protein